MKKSIALFATHLCVSIAENKSDSGEEVALPRAVAPNDDIVLWRERINRSLIFVALEALYDDLLDMHLDLGADALRPGKCSRERRETAARQFNAKLRVLN